MQKNQVSIPSVSLGFLLPPNFHYFFKLWCFILGNISFLCGRCMDILPPNTVLVICSERRKPVLILLLLLYSNKFKMSQAEGEGNTWRCCQHTQWVAASLLINLWLSTPFISMRSQLLNLHGPLGPQVSKAFRHVLKSICIQETN